MNRYDFRDWCRLLSIVTGGMNFMLWVFALLGVGLWGPLLLAWTFLVCVLWALFVGAPLALLAWFAGRDM